MNKLYTHFRMVTLVTLIGLIIIPVLYWAHFLRAPSVTCEEAMQLMADAGYEAILIDTRPRKEYEKFSLKEAVSIPLDAIRTGSPGQWHGQLEGKKHILVICKTGLTSARATNTLRRLGFDRAFNVRGGLDAWLDSGKRGPGKKAIMARTPRGDVNAVPRLTFTIFEQAIICVAAFALKPLYEIMSLLVVIMLWKSKEADLVPLRRAMIAFFMGENCCAINFLFFNEESILFEFLHIYGMLVCFGLVTYALMKAMDIRVFHFTEAEKKCALLPLCKRCYKYQVVSCNLRLLFLFAIPATAVVACMPLVADMNSYFFVGKVFGNDVGFAHSMYQQILEVRLFPLASLVFLGISFIILLRYKEKGIEGSKIFFAMSIGPLGFSMLRFFLFWAYSQNPLWAEAWEEITEFLLVSFVLWIIIRVRQTVKVNNQ